MFAMTENKWFIRCWTLFMLVYLVTIVFVKPAHAGCSWADPSEYVAADMAMGFGAAAGMCALFFPPLGAAAVLLGGIGAITHMFLAMSGC